MRGRSVRRVNSTEPAGSVDGALADNYS